MNITFPSNLLRSLLKNVYFVNGTAYAGKSTMVRLLAEKYDGICCGENFHMELLSLADPVHQPNLCYFDTMSGWQEFISRTPDEYDDWISGNKWEVIPLELIKLIQLVPQEKKIFVDTNMPPEILWEISDYHHVGILLSPQSMSVNCFFDRDDPDKKFILSKIQEATDLAAAMENYRNCIARINSPEHYREYAESGFFCYVRTQSSTIEDALSRLEQHFQLEKTIGE